MYKKGDKRVCDNYRGILPINIPAILLTRIIERRTKSKIENTIEDIISFIFQGSSKTRAKKKTKNAKKKMKTLKLGCWQLQETT